jgi:hypothetical protein
MEATRVHQELTTRWAQSEVVTLVSFCPHTERSTVPNSVVRAPSLCILLGNDRPESSRTKLGRGFRCGMSAVLKHRAAPVMLEG